VQGLGNLETHEKPIKAKPTIWTERMLEALDKGVKGGKWHSLIDKVHRMTTLKLAWQEVRANQGSAGVDRIKVEDFGARLEENLTRLQQELQSKTYRPNKVRKVEISKGDGKTRALGIPTVRDRVAQTAVKMVIEPIFEHEFHETSFGYRPKRQAKQALKRVEKKLKEGGVYVVDADIRSYFDTIDHIRLKQLICHKIGDGKLLDLINLFLKQEVEGQGATQQGTPQGSALSPLLANIYLDEFDHRAEAGGYHLTRYADDLVILCTSKEAAEEALKFVKRWMTHIGLELNLEKTNIVDMQVAGNYFDFLGYRFKRTGRGRIIRLPKDKAIKSLRERIRHHTRRTNGQSLKVVILKINPILRGWYEYFKHVYRGALGEQDSWIRFRLRRILRKRHKMSGFGAKLDNIIWPNVFFQDLGLFCLLRARDQEFHALRAH